MSKSDSAIDLPDLAATDAFGRRLAKALRRGDVVALKGGLGVGKTTLARAIVAGLSPDLGDVPSPTFTLVQTYPVELAMGRRSSGTSISTAWTGRTRSMSWGSRTRWPRACR